MARSSDLSWCAGFFDGEGCVFLSNQKSRYGVSRHVLRISITQNCRRTLAAFHRRLRVNAGRIEEKNGGRCHQLVYCGIDAAEILRKMLPHLVLKKRQAEIAIRFQKMIRHGRSAPLSIAEQGARSRCWKRVKELKR